MGVICQQATIEQGRSLGCDFIACLGKASRCGRASLATKASGYDRLPVAVAWHSWRHCRFHPSIAQWCIFKGLCPVKKF